MKAVFLFPLNSVCIFHSASVDRESQDFGQRQEYALGFKSVILTEEGKLENLSMPESMEAGWPTIILCVPNSSCPFTSQTLFTPGCVSVP